MHSLFTIPLGVWQGNKVADLETILQRNVAELRQRIGEACRRAGRARSEVTLVAATKYVNADIARLLLPLGITNLGESRPQELWRKAAAIPEATWHLIGHLQRNKIDRTLPVARLIHSVDSLRLLEALEIEARKQNRRVDVLLEFNLSGEEAKHGFSMADASPGSAPLLADALRPIEFVRVVGLMTMAALVDNPEKARPAFAALRGVRDTLKARVPPPHDLRQLSMGMTNDFELAIEEGATLVRIGTALFHGLENLSA